MKAIPKYSDFELDYDKFPIIQVGGIADMNTVKRMDYKDSMFENAKEQWMQEAEQQISKLKFKLKDWQDSHSRVINEKCPTDEKHCTCVPALRRQIDRLKDFAIWLTGCGYDFTQHEYFIKQRDKLLK